MSFKKLLCIVGPTATGKTEIGLVLAKKFNGELVSCDSRQVYIGLDIGSGKLPGQKVEFSKYLGYWVIDGVKVSLYDLIGPENQYSVSDYIKDATEAMSQLEQQNKLPIVVGGTGFYLEGLLRGIETNLVEPDLKLRHKLEQLDLSYLQQRLHDLDGTFFNSLNNSERNNKRRLIRKIEILEKGEALRVKGEDKNSLANSFDILKIGLTAPKEILNGRIEKRVVKRVKDGMLEEAKKLHEEGLSFERMRQLGLEYGVMADFLEGVIKNQNEFIEILQTKIKQFAKRQMTWFKRDKSIVWFDITETDFKSKVESLVQDWYNAEVLKVSG